MTQRTKSLIGWHRFGRRLVVRLGRPHGWRLRLRVIVLRPDEREHDSLAARWDV